MHKSVAVAYDEIHAEVPTFGLVGLNRIWLICAASRVSVLGSSTLAELPRARFPRALKEGIARSDARSAARKPGLRGSGEVGDAHAGSIRTRGTFRAGEQMKPVLSTRDLSRIFQVNESSVKRWADLGVLHCFRTPGGHRKFTVEEVLRFAREQKFVLDDDALRLLGVAGQFSRPAVQEEIEALGDDFFVALTQKNSDAGSRLLLEAHASHLSVETICDAIIRRTLDRMESLRTSGQMEPFEERIASMKLLEALVRLSDAVGSAHQAGPHALLACTPGQAHDIELRCIRLVLQRRGWKITYMGGAENGAIEAAVRRLQPNVVFLCASVPAPGLGPMVNAVASAAHDAGARLVVGGRAFSDEGSLGLLGVEHVVRSVADADAFIERLSTTLSD